MNGLNLIPINPNKLDHFVNFRKKMGKIQTKDLQLCIVEATDGVFERFIELSFLSDEKL